MRRRTPRLRFLAAALPALLAAGCVPYVADQQSARMLPARGIELNGSYSTVSFRNEGESEHVQDQFGARFAYGLSDRTELRFTYERIELDDDFEADGLNLFGAGVKLGLVPERLALYVPVGMMTGEDLESGDTWTVAPTLLGTWRASPQFELNPSVKAIYPFAAEDPEVFLGFHLGAGISTDLDRWAVRPEVGAVINPGDDGTVLGFTLGFSFRP